MDFTIVNGSSTYVWWALRHMCGCAQRTQQTLVYTCAYSLRMASVPMIQEKHLLKVSKIIFTYLYLHSKYIGATPSRRGNSRKPTEEIKKRIGYFGISTRLMWVAPIIPLSRTHAPRTNQNVHFYRCTYQPGIRLSQHNNYVSCSPSFVAIDCHIILSNFALRYHYLPAFRLFFHLSKGRISHLIVSFKMHNDVKWTKAAIFRISPFPRIRWNGMCTQMMLGDFSNASNLFKSFTWHVHTIRLLWNHHNHCQIPNRGLIFKYHHVPHSFRGKFAEKRIIYSLNFIISFNSVVSAVECTYFN